MESNAFFFFNWLKTLSIAGWQNGWASFHSWNLSNPVAMQETRVKLNLNLSAAVCVCVLSGASTTIMKQCASWATCSGAASTASVDSNGNGNKVGCCNGYDLCNFSAGGMVRAHTTLLLLTVGVLLLRTHWGHLWKLPVEPNCCF